MDATIFAPRLSLLWPPDAPARGRFKACNAWTIADLDLEFLADALCLHKRYRDQIRAILYTFCDDAGIIAYRQEILEDLLRYPALADTFEHILPSVLEISYLGGSRHDAETPLHETIYRLGELELYGECILKLYRALEKIGISLHSRGLCALREALGQIVADSSFQSLMQQLPEMRASLSGLRSITIGINLDHLLRPVAATLLSVSHETFSGRSFLDKLLGRQNGTQGIGPLHGLDTASLPDVRNHPFMQPLFRDLDKVIRDVVRPIADFLARYVYVNSQFLWQVEQEIVFYLGGVRLVKRLAQQGLPMCLPQSAPSNACICKIEGIYNVNLALRMCDARDAGETSAEMVLNDVRFDDDGRVFVLTGPNRGGKTTFTQAVGLAHILYQAGLYVPGRSARISPVDAIYTHFPSSEQFNLETGRLGEEAARLSAIFDQATHRSLILLNESLFSTSPGECLYLARDIVRALRYLGVRAIYATHLHELANNLDEINEQVPGHSRVVSLVATIERISSPNETAQPQNDDDASNVRRTYRIERGPPMGCSYAREIAARYGISYEKLAETIRNRRAGAN